LGLMGNTKHILLLGAGFSRNWGGWLTSEFMGELCSRVIDRPWLAEMLRVGRNFEDVLELRRSHAREPNNEQAQEDVRQLEPAIRETFRDMNLTFSRLSGLSFSTDADRSVDTYMAAFDGIYTLNQDLLLEFQYDARGRWEGWYCPGVTTPCNWKTEDRETRVDMTELVASQYAVEPRKQPIYHLHGAAHWRDINDRDVLVIGADKDRAIKSDYLLRPLHKKFSRDLCAGDTKVMVIGYSFGDAHINRHLLDGVDQGLKMYLVNPAGLAAYAAHKDQHLNRNELLRIPLIGMSTRPLSVTFGTGNDPSFMSFQRFLES
jgi:hypothetical protein